MAMFKADAVRPEEYRRFEHQTPKWYKDAKLGIFVHWGAYSVPAWATPIGELGTFEDQLYWYTNNPYAEWYYNTLRIEGSPTQQHQEEVYGGADYDDFLDQWKAESFDAGQFMDLVKEVGARYFVVTTKHHDGITLWDAPRTGDRNTVKRGPKRDLVQEFHDAAVARDVHFGTYYSGGLDWYFTDCPAIVDEIEGVYRPVDKEYADYAYDQVVDLIDKYQPELLWGDIEYPDAGKTPGEKSLIDVFDRFYAAAPAGVINDRWGVTHWDFRTSEYEQGRDLEGDWMWEQCRGIGPSFAYNQLETDEDYYTGPAVVRLFVDIVSRGGNFLLNIGPKASGEIPKGQVRTLNYLGAWNAMHGDAIFESFPVPECSPSETPWLRWTQTDAAVHAFVSAELGETITVRVPEGVDGSRAEIVGLAAVVDRTDEVISVKLSETGSPFQPIRVSFPK